MNQVYIGLGSNMAEPHKQLVTAVDCLAKLPDCQLLKCSSFYKSRPMGPQDQSDYVNAVVLLETSLRPHQLLDQTQLIENQHGRVRKANRWGPRTLDLDILLYGQQQISTQNLTIPHYGMKEREFVLYPLFEISSDLVLPDGEVLSALLQSCPLNGLQKITAQEEN